MYLFPSIDLLDGKVVRLYKGDYDRETTYETDALQQAQMYADAGATWMHLIDLDGARTGRIAHMKAIAEICEKTSLKIEVGGGVRSEGVIDSLLSAGVERVILGTAALEDWQWFEGLMGNPTYRGRLVLGLDARKGRVAVHGWEKQLDATANENGCWEIRVSDLRSTNGTFVYSRGKLPEGGHFQVVPLRSCQRVTEGFPATIFDGDLVALGRGEARMLYELQLPTAR